jgi:SAM-dependent methyltransferase
MRVVDLDRDMSDVIPTGTSLDSEFLFDRMTERTLELAGAAPGRHILDVASGVGQDAVRMARSGADVVGAEPSGRMLGMAGLASDRQGGRLPHWVRGWGDSLPFAAASFDAVICKGALDHFDRPEQAIGEMARVTRASGRVVLAIANFESLACRTGRFSDEIRQDFRGRAVRRDRRTYDCPSDHFTRYELELMREQAERHLELEIVDGVSLLWGAPGWSRIVGGLPGGAARRLLEGGDRLARRWPTLADVIVLAGRPRRHEIAGSAKPS